MWDIKGRFSDALQDDATLAWDLSPGGKYTLSLHVVGVKFQYYYSIFCLTYFYQDGIEENSTAAASIPSSKETSHLSDSPPDASEKKSIKNPVSQLIRTTLNIPFHLTQLSDHKSDLRIAYAKYLAIFDTLDVLDKMRKANTWTQKSTFTDVVEVFMSKSVYHRAPSKIFPSVPNYPLMEKWLLNTDDAPSAVEVWRGKSQTYEHLQEILKSYLEQEGKSGSSSDRKGKKRQDHSPDTSEIAKKKKGKGKKTGDSKKKGSSSKSHD